MAEDDTKRASVPTTVPLGPSTSIDLSWLPEAERKALLVDYTRGVLDVGKKAQDLHVDAAVLNTTLQTLANTTREVSESGNAVTITHTQTTSIGRTEVMMGNTQQAQSGKLTKAQTGVSDWMPYYIVGAIAAITLIVIVALLAR
jgi:hypothetical protein